MFRKRWLPLILLFALCLVSVAARADEPEDSADAETLPPGTVAVADRKDLEALANDPGGSYILTSDIDMSGVDWTPIDFHGLLDGNGYTIYNLKITSPGTSLLSTGDGNHKLYDTRFAAFIADGTDAVIRNLQLLNVRVDVTTDSHCFAAGLVGYTENTTLENNTVTSRIRLRQSAVMTGVSGLVGYGSGTITDCTVDTELVFIDTNKNTDCEEFLGGVLACGYADISGCTASVRGYASVHGYVHNGGLVGMYHIHPRTVRHAGFVKDNSVDAWITFFENISSRRAYCKAVIGEKLNNTVSVRRNTVISFTSIETKDFYTVLQPDNCPDPSYTETVIPPSCDTFGYSAFSCQTCGYTYKDDYTAPVHAYDEGVVVPSSCTERGYTVFTCTLCGHQTMGNFTDPAHTYDAGTIIPSTCTEQGCTLYTCTVCGEIFRDKLTEPAHTPSDWVLSRAATLDAPGEEVQVCEICGQIIATREIPRLEYITCILLNHSTLLLNRGTGVQLMPAWLPENPADTNLIWSSSNPDIVSVDDDGTAIAKRRGSAYITCTALQGGASAQCAIRVEYGWQQWLLYFLAFGWLWF